MLYRQRCNTTDNPVLLCRVVGPGRGGRAGFLPLGVGLASVGVGDRLDTAGQDPNPSLPPAFHVETREGLGCNFATFHAATQYFTFHSLRSISGLSPPCETSRGEEGGGGRAT
eukprot:356375-Chlamydomonas_euryale.AAC.9